VRTEERERMRSDREPGMAIVREHPLPASEIAKLGRRGGLVEQERQLLRLPVRPGNRLRTEGEPELPEELTARGRPKPSQAPPLTSVSSASRERRVRLARSTMLRNGPLASRSATSASASSFPREAM
jgi:hypothetical protein